MKIHSILNSVLGLLFWSSSRELYFVWYVSLKSPPVLENSCCPCKWVFFVNIVSLYIQFIEKNIVATIFILCCSNAIDLSLFFFVDVIKKRIKKNKKKNKIKIKKTDCSVTSAKVCLFMHLKSSIINNCFAFDFL